MDYQRRIAALRAGMAERGLVAYLVPADAGMEYLSGVKRVYRNYTHMRQNCLELAGLVITPSDVVYFIPRLTGMGTLPFLEGTAVTKAVSIQDPDLTGETWIRELKALGLSGKHIGVNRDISAQAVLMLQNVLEAKVTEESDLVDSLRAVKDEEEIGLMRKNAEIADQVYHEIMPMIRPGERVRNIEREIERLFETHGCACPSFPGECIVLGPNSGPIFGMNYDRIEKGYTVAFDFGGMYQGYCSDFGRTVFVGEPDKELIRYHELVMKAQSDAMEVLKSGQCTGQMLNDIAHGVMEEAGVGPNFIHRLGHCIGKDVHERPFIAPGEQTVLKPGMTFTVEPSIVVVKRCCVRVEDVVLRTETGYECLNKITKDIVVVEA